MKKIILSLIIAIIASVNVYTAEIFKNEIFAVHPKAGLLGNFYSADFSKFQNSVDCGKFTSGSGVGYSLFLTFEKPISEKMQFGFGLGYTDRSGELSINNISESRDLTTHKVTQVETKNTVKPSISFLEIQPEVRYILSDDFINGPLRLMGGLRFNLAMTKTFEQNESIVSPSGAVFVNASGVKTTERKIASGDISSMKAFGLGLSVGIENMLKAGKNSYFTQQLVFDYNLGDFTDDAAWKAMGVRLELGFRYSLTEEPEPIKIEPVKEVKKEAPPVVVEVPKPVLKLKYVGFDGEFQTGNELLATLPLINSVFFESNAESPSAFYKNKVSTKDYLRGDAVEIHGDVLARIAEIVKKNPKATVVIEGATAGEKYESAGLALSKKRSDEIKKALVACGVEEKRISVNPRLTPRILSNESYETGIVENRRAEIIVKNAPLQEYVDLEKFAELKGTAKYMVEIENLPKGSYAELSSNFLDKPMKVYKSGMVEIPVTKRVDDKLTDLPTTTTLTYEKAKTENQDKIALAQLNQKSIELFVGNFEAILRFDYNSSSLTDENKDLLKQLAEKLPIGKTIVILGSADAIGGEESNLKLSKQRAQATEQFINSIAKDKFKFETGVNTEKFKEETPQGRFLNRSIRIRVK